MLFPGKVTYYGTVGSSTVQVFALPPEGGSHSSNSFIRRDGTVVSLSEDRLHRWGMRRDCKGDMVTQNILRIFSKTAPKGAYTEFEI